VNDCLNLEVRDALPDLLNGRLSELDTATMNAHVASCADCRAELALLRETRATAYLAPALDIERIAAAIATYGGQAVTVPASRERRTVVSRMWKFAAAAVVVVAGGWLVSTQRSDPAPDVSRTAITSPAVTQAPSTQDANPSSVAAASAPASKAPAGGTSEPTREIQVASLSLVGSTADISDSDLEQLVLDLDAIDAIPADEPTPVTITVDDIDAANE
jgi:anti-sigma factor RsiW